MKTYGRPTLFSAIRSFWLLLVLSLTFANVRASAQVISDLADPRLGAHMKLPQYNLPGTPIPEMLSATRAAAPSRGVEWKGLDIHTSEFEPLPLGPLAPALLQLYQKQACQVDAIVIGRIIASAYHLSETGTAIYGDHIFLPDAILKDNQGSPIRYKASIVVTRPGGSLGLEDGNVNFEPQSFPRFQTGISYIQFLRFIPETSAYRALDSFSTLVADGNNWVIARKPFSKFALPGFSREAIEGTLRNWLTSCK